MGFHLLFSLRKLYKGRMRKSCRVSERYPVGKIFGLIIGKMPWIENIIDYDIIKTCVYKMTTYTRMIYLIYFKIQIKK